MMEDTASPVGGEAMVGVTVEDSGEVTNGATTMAVEVTWAGGVRARWEAGEDIVEAGTTPGITEEDEEAEAEEEVEAR